MITKCNHTEEELCEACKAKNRDTINKSHFSGMLSLRADMVAEIEKETADVNKAEEYTDGYKTGIIEGMRLVMVIYDEIVEKSKAR